ncbi:MAG TPA: divalent-cation tolerance protein CutA [Pyrinomonadaceae bacterium]|nr:divalent-cation tolerance protein CutA [Pyrinomonadaceae bacterium]HMP65234.1 divalent-cation tolerance protein CutA [Pyrinomonadaceae bacterium]
MEIVLTTTSDRGEAERLARGLVECRLAACVQILAPMTSVYFWEGDFQEDDEHLLLIKTVTNRYDEVEKYILDRHSYENPEIAAIKAERVAPGYLKWLMDHVG